MSAGTVFAGVIAFLLGAVGLLQLYGRAVVPVNLAVVSAYLTFEGALVLFGVIAIVGLGLIIGGLVTLGEEEPRTVVVEKAVQPSVVPPTVVVTQPVVGASSGATPTGVVTGYPPLSELEFTVLRYVSQGKREDEIVRMTGVSREVISEKMTALYSKGYITDKHTLTERGFEALQQTDAQRVYAQPSA